MTSKSKTKIPPQRTAGRCHRCGAEGVPLQPDDLVDGRQRCIESWKGCSSKWRAHCPIWCTTNHINEDPFREGVWFHHSGGIDVVVGAESKIFHVFRVDLCNFEAIGGAMEPPVIHMGDNGMTSEQARSLASALVAAANMADMTPAELERGQAFEKGHRR